MAEGILRECVPVVTRLRHAVLDRPGTRSFLEAVSVTLAGVQIDCKQSLFNSKIQGIGSKTSKFLQEWRALAVRGFGTRRTARRLCCVLLCMCSSLRIFEQKRECWQSRVQRALYLFHKGSGECIIGKEAFLRWSVRKHCMHCLTFSVVAIWQTISNFWDRSIDDIDNSKSNFT